MSIKIDKYFGYVIEMHDEYNRLSDDQKDFLECEAESDNFVAICKRGSYPKDKMTLIHDGMNGEYTKLMYVLDFCCDVCSDDEGIVNKVNEYLDKVEIPKNIKEKLLEEYRSITGSDSEPAIRLEYFNHWN